MNNVTQSTKTVKVTHSQSAKLQNSTLFTDSEYQSELKRLIPSAIKNRKQLISLLESRVQLASVGVKTIGQPCKIYFPKSMGVTRHNSFDDDTENPFTLHLGLKQVDESEVKGKVHHLTITLVIYYSVLDVLLCHPKEIREQMAKSIEKQRGHKFKGKKATFLLPGVYEKDGYYYRVSYKLCDLFAFNSNGLKTMAIECDVPVGSKDVLDDRKHEMVAVAKDNNFHLETGKPYWQIHDEYLINDVDMTEQIFIKKYELIKQFYKDLGMPESLHVNNPNTVGSFTNGLAVNMLHQALGHFDETDSFDEKGQINPNYVNKLRDYQLPASGNTLKKEHGEAGLLLTHVVGGLCKNYTPTIAKILNTVIINTDLSSCYGSSIKGFNYPVGIPTVFTNPLDRDDRESLGDFLDTFEDELVKHTWFLFVSTTDNHLSFDFDLLLSKIAKLDRYKVYEDEDEFSQQDEDPLEASKVPGDTTLLHRQIKHGLINHDVLQLIRNVTTKAEYKELMTKLRVDCGLMYRKSGFKAKGSLGAEYDLNGKVYHKKDSVKSSTIVQVDERLTVWTAVNLGEAGISKILAKRKHHKAVMEELAKQMRLQGADVELLQQEFNKHNAAQTLCKLAVNCFYGVFASSYYQTGRENEFGSPIKPMAGNLVLANNITARARVAVWCLSKLGGNQPITDGSVIDANKVWRWEWEGKRGARVGFQVLHDLTKYPKLINKDKLTRNFQLKIDQVPLAGGGEWKLESVKLADETAKNRHKPLATRESDMVFSNGSMEVRGDYDSWGDRDGQPGFDSLILKELRRQFSFPDTKTGELRPIDVFAEVDGFEIASKHVYQSVAFQSQANYCLIPFSGNVKDINTYEIKARGYKGCNGKVNLSSDLQGENIVHPLKTFFYELMNGVPISPALRTYTHELLGVNKFNETEKATNDFLARGFLPHCSYTRSSHFRPISISMFHYQSIEQRDSWFKHHETLREKFGWGLEQFFLDDDQNLDYEKAIVEIQRAIYDGKNWYAEGLRIKEYKTHPQYTIDNELDSKLPAFA